VITQKRGNMMMLVLLSDNADKNYDLAA
jgi:hypothetical protein